MYSNLVKRVAKIKQDLIKIKTNQASQNDSYQFYLYRTDNLYSPNSEASYKIQFIPEIKDPSQVVCMFRDFDKLANASSGVCYADDPLTYYFTRFSYTQPPVSERQVYVTCIANCKGVLVVTQI